jgi:uncharacterized damage-inducible protein DinB
MADPLPEPWLRGSIPGVHPLVMPVLFSFMQVREDLQKHTAGLTREQVWRRFENAPSLGFHLKHIAGSVDRLTSYLCGNPLSEEQLQFLKTEAREDTELDALLQEVDRSLQAAEAKLQALNPETLYDLRTVGRKQLPTTVIGLIVHLAEHTQRHLGQAITTATLARQAVE